MMRVCAWDISVRSEKALQREKDTTGKESDRRKKRLKGNQIEIPRRWYRGCSRYGVYKWKAMNRWIRRKEIKAEAEWTARWVFRYDKSPRKSPFLPFVPFSRFSPLLASFRIRICWPPVSSLFSYLVAFFSFFLFLLLFFHLTVLVKEEIARLFDSRIDTRWEERDENDTPHTWISFRQSSRCHSQLAKWIARFAKVFQDIPTTDRVLLACRFKLVVKIVDFNIFEGIAQLLPPMHLTRLNLWQYKRFCAWLA